jgi:hypothetical protein
MVRFIVYFVAAFFATQIVARVVWSIYRTWVYAQ